MSNYPLSQKQETNLNKLSNDRFYKQNQSPTPWKIKYHENVNHIRKQLDDLRKATDELKIKISENQTRIKKALEARAPKQSRKTQTSTKENQKPQETVSSKETSKQKDSKQITKKQEMLLSTTSSLPEEQHSFLFDFRDKNAKTVWGKIVRYLEDFNEFLFRKIVKERIQPRRSLKKQRQQRQNPQKLSTQILIIEPDTRRFNSTKSLRG